ncbi:hypothetical protein BEP19_03205 [Ammoniphilus oxalaticus]|uniref:Conjugal transfer protein TraX n=1 Tax=Ammoniphilus oxalaticus TaxID=66863 RepID=A0A419SP74_9BACL|nr:hypothetical protein BEP19_03205 [Ammoniphilus oxalaticus]
MQLLAMTTMLIDHIGLLFFDDQPIFRMIGRLSFPVYCFLLVKGYERTRSVKRYLTRLLIIALISQLPYSLLFQTVELNVVFTLFMGLLILYVWDEEPESSSSAQSDRETRLTPAVRKSIVATLLLISCFIPMDYGMYGILLILIYRSLTGTRLLSAHFGLNLFFLISQQWVLQMYSILFTILLVFYKSPKGIRVPLWLYRSFYPAHLVGLYLFQLLFYR